MLLLDLPLEVFEEIIAGLAKKVGQRNVVRYRLICKTFANTIRAYILATTVPVNLAKFLENPHPTRLFETYSGEILHKAAMRRQTIRNQVIDFVRAITKASEPDPTLYPARMMVVCMSMMSLEPKYLRNYIKGTEIVNKEKRPCSLKDMMPAIAAASGHIALFQEANLTPAMLLKQSHDILPSALKAAVVAEQYTVLERILEYLVDNVKGKRDSGSWKDMRNAAQKIGKALCMAIRLHKNVAGNMLFDFRDKNKLFAKFAPVELGGWLVKDVIQYCNTALLYRVLEVSNPGFIAHVKGGSKAHYSLDRQAMETLYRRGGIAIWNMLLKDGAIEPNKVYLDKTPLQCALQRRRYDVAHILIENGAAIDSITPDGNNVLWQAANYGHVKDAEFLLDYGADPDSRGKNGKSAFEAADSKRYGKCRFLLETVRDHGKENLKRSDLWETYENKISFQYWLG